MSQVDLKEQYIKQCWSRITSLSATLANRDNANYKWYSLLHFVHWPDLLRMKADWQATMVAYYIRLTEYEPRQDQKIDYNELLHSIDQLVGLLNN